MLLLVPKGNRMAFIVYRNADHFRLRHAYQLFTSLSESFSFHIDLHRD